MLCSQVKLNSCQSYEFPNKAFSQSNSFLQGITTFVISIGLSFLLICHATEGKRSRTRDKNEAVLVRKLSFLIPDKSLTN